MPKVTTTNAKWYVIRCFNLNDHDNTGFLSIDKSRTSRDVYRIVDSLEDAMKFPSINVYGIKGFGTPKQWIDFFKGEYELRDWKFHLVKIASPIVNKI